MIPYIKIQSTATELYEENSTKKMLLGGLEDQLIFETSYGYDISGLQDEIGKEGNKTLVFYAQILQTKTKTNKTIQ